MPLSSGIIFDCAQKYSLRLSNSLFASRWDMLEFVGSKAHSPGNKRLFVVVAGKRIAVRNKQVPACNRR